tara:strand:- start:439 stop:1167 length:729 start_codon:yes stop_codon:yes gene_type:complete
MALMNPQQLEEAPPLDPGLVNEPTGDMPIEGVESIEDDVPTTAKEGDFILPYESVLFIGLNNINIEVKKAMKQAQADGVEIEGVDPAADVPIKISNMEYRIPKELIEYIGLQRLETYREKGLELRAQLEKDRGDKQQAFMPPAAEEAPPMQIPQEQQMAEAAPPQQDMMPQQGMMPPPPPQQGMMMQRGGSVEKQRETLHSAKQGSPLQSPQRLKKDEPIDMRGGGLVARQASGGLLLRSGS